MSENTAQTDETKHLLKFSSLNTLKNTVSTDFQTYQWFKAAIKHHNSSHNIKNLNTVADLFYSAFRQIFFFLFISSITIIAYRNAYLYLWLPAVLILLYKKIHLKQQKLLQPNLETFLKTQIEGNIEHYSLFEITEIISKKLKVRSLVDVIYIQDKIFRVAFLLGCITLCFITPQSIINAILYLIIICYCVSYISNIPVYYNSLLLKK